MPHQRALLLALTLLCWVQGPTRARAESVLFACSESCPLSLFEALELELRGHGAFLVARLSPSGFSVAAHEADAQRMATLMPAAAVLWIEREPPLRVRVFALKEGSVREAPLATPPEEIDARIFAAIAGNVVLQAIGAPGHEGGVAAPATVPSTETTTPSAETTSAPLAAAATEPISQAERAHWPAAQGAAKTPPRFFLRAGAALGFAFLKRGMAADRPPTKELVNEALQNQLANGDPGAGRDFLAQHGYDCDFNQTSANSFVANNCQVALTSTGAQWAPGIDLAAGANISARFALALTLRIAPDAGYGSLNHALFGTQVEYTLTQPSSTGFWANAGLGFAFGRIQVQPSQPLSSEGPYVTSGPYEAHAMIGTGYRFLRGHFGLYATATVRLLFPDQLWMLEPNLGLEGRL